MKKMFGILVFTLVVLAFATLAWAGSHTSITIDGANTGGEWAGTAPTADNSWQYSDGGNGYEFIWKDAAGDERTDFANPDKRVDITEIRTTGDATYVYFYFKMNDIDVTSGNGASCIQIAIDTDLTTNSGQTYFAGYSDTQVASSGAANWEYLIITTFGPNWDSLYVYNTSWSNISSATHETQAISVDNDVIELRVRWSLLGIDISSPKTVRLTIISYRQVDWGIDSWDCGGASDALDVMTTTAGNTWNEVSDGDVDYYPSDVNGGTTYKAGGESLPVVLSTFTVQYLDNTPTLYWVTQSETDNLGWYVYRNIEDDFVTAQQVSGLIPGHGTTTEPQSYIYKDEIENAMPGEIYWYWLESIDLGGEVHQYSTIVNVQIPDPSTEPDIPVKTVLYELQNSPNPFKGSTTISFTLSEAALVEITVYNILGERVKTLSPVVANENEEREVFWNGKDEAGNEVPSGIYLYKLNTDKKSYSGKMIILR